MAKLLIHIGCPKTATTSLQENVFLGLHELNLINYLGCVKFNKLNFKGTDISSKLRRSYLDQNKGFDISEFLDEEKLNVISDEKFTLPAFYINLQHKSKTNTSEFINNYISLFKENHDVSVLISIRNQTDLIFSQFIQKYSYLYNETDYKTFDEFKRFIFENLDEFKVYNFNHMIDRLLKHIPLNKIHIILFENLKSDNHMYFNSLSESLNGVNKEVLKNLFYKEVYRKRKEKQNKFQVKIFKPINFLPENLVKYKLNPQNFKESLINKMFIEKAMDIAFYNKKDQEEIIAFFNDENKIFWSKLNLPFKAGLELGYFN